MKVEHAIALDMHMIAHDRKS